MTTGADADHRPAATPPSAGTHVNRELLEAIINNARGSVYSLDRELRYTSFNRSHQKSMKRICGVDIAIGGYAPGYWQRPIDRENAERCLRRALAGERFSIEMTEGSEAGAARPPPEDPDHGDLGPDVSEIRFYPLLDDNGEIAGVSVFVRDVTRARRSEDRLRLSEERFRKMLETAADLITVVDTDGTIQYVSPNTERVLGYTAEDTVGRDIMEFVHPDSATLVRRLFVRELVLPYRLPP